MFKPPFLIYKNWDQVKKKESTEVKKEKATRSKLQKGENLINN